MTVLVCEDNLMWSARLVNGVKASGHDPVLVDRWVDELPAGEVAIVNLGAERMRPSELVLRLKEAGVYVVGHAGHKEKPLMTMGRESGCDEVVTNSYLSNKLPELLGKLDK